MHRENISYILDKSLDPFRLMKEKKIKQLLVFILILFKIADYFQIFQIFRRLHECIEFD